MSESIADDKLLGLQRLCAYAHSCNKHLDLSAGKVGWLKQGPEVCQSALAQMGGVELGRHGNFGRDTDLRLSGIVP